MVGTGAERRREKANDFEGKLSPTPCQVIILTLLPTKRANNTECNTLDVYFFVWVRVLRNA